MKFFRYCYGDFALSNEPGIEIDFHRMSLSDMSMKLTINIFSICL